MQEENKERKDGVLREGQGFSEEGESQIKEDKGSNKNGCAEMVQAVTQRSQKSQGPLVCWERFLPLGSLKVLLVENDDSTRHVVSALLRNCGYEVMAAADGLQAWKLLEDLTNHFDLVLTEVFMPSITGLGLLRKIMSHKTLRNIPVIMMSSLDSMNVVFKCLSKGAVDFLGKPIRKNELKILWQHVWRKCHSASGSGSESAVRTQKSTKTKSADESDDNTSINREDDNGSIGLNLRDGSDNGSGTQSSWTKRAVEPDSPKSMSPWGQSADLPDSTCAQVIHSREQACINNWVPMIATKECEQQNDELDNHLMGKDLEIGVPRSPNLLLEDPRKKVVTTMEGINGEKFSEINLDKEGDQMKEGKLELMSEKPNGELRNQAAGPRGIITSDTDGHTESTMLCMGIGMSKVSNKRNGVIYETKDMPFLELSLKRNRDDGDSETSAHDRNVLKHSDLSAFSRYNSGLTANQSPIGNVGSCSPSDNSPGAVKTESMQNVQSTSNSIPPNQRSNGSSNNDMGSTTNNPGPKAVSLSDKLAPKSTDKCCNPSSTSQTVHNGHAHPFKPTAQGKPDTEITNTIMAEVRTRNKQVQVQFHHQHYHHHHHHHRHHHHVHNKPHQQQVDHDLPSKNVAAAATQCGSCNNASKHCLNGSASGSHHGSNFPNGSSTVLNLRGANTESDNGIGGKGETSSGTGLESYPGVVQNGYTVREAALRKFRQKRKERCFEKKVRYQSRKTLAEQRPRVRGQFVRQLAPEDKEKCSLS